MDYLVCGVCQEFHSPRVSTCLQAKSDALAVARKNAEVTAAVYEARIKVEQDRLKEIAAIIRTIDASATKREGADGFVEGYSIELKTGW
jgi:hypothetical protein